MAQELLDGVQMRAGFQQVLMKNPMISQVIRQTAAYRNAQNKSLDG